MCCARGGFRPPGCFRPPTRHVLLALDKLRGYRNKIAHNWDQDTLPDFVETPLPYMDEMESSVLHIDIKDGGDGDLSAEGSLRLRTVWLLARLFCETRNYTLAKMAKLNPYKALYGEGSPKAYLPFQRSRHFIQSSSSIANDQLRRPFQ